MNKTSATSRNRDPKELGRRGEVFALGWLMGHGYRILSRNWRCPIGELDLVALDGDCIVAVEVKTRSGVGYGAPAEAVGRDKLARLHRLLHAWCRDHDLDAGLTRRVDVVAVVWTPDAVAPESVLLYKAVTA